MSPFQEAGQSGAILIHLYTDTYAFVIRSSLTLHTYALRDARLCISPPTPQGVTACGIRKGYSLGESEGVPGPRKGRGWGGGVGGGSTGKYPKRSLIQAFWRPILGFRV